MSMNAVGHVRCGCFAALALGVCTAMSAQSSLQQKPSAPASTDVPVSTSQEMPAYEVATIKPPAPVGFAMPLRMYIQSAFGIPVNSTGWVSGPEWINSARYVIQGKPPESIRIAMQTMNTQDRIKETRLMQQSLLADRFKLKAHFETREMPVYELVVAKGGPKLKENPDAGKGQAAVGRSTIRGIAVPVHVVADMLESVPDIGGRVVADKTGLTGNYDFLLKWTSMDAAAPYGSSATAVPSDPDGASLFTAIEEQLGLKLVLVKQPGQVLIIDHIERPTEN